MGTASALTIIDRRIVTAMIASAEAFPPMLRLLTLNDAAVQPATRD